MNVNLRAFTQPVGLMRTMAIILTCLTVSLVAVAGYKSAHLYWAWCMFTWCFCFFFTFLILILEFTNVNTKLHSAWEDFTTGFGILASLMLFSTSIIYPAFFNSRTSPHEIAASVVSWVCFGVYAGEAVITHLSPSGQTSGFLSTLTGLMKMLEAFLACLIFASLQKEQFNSPELKWCVAVYSLCFIFAILIIVLTVGRITSFFPFSFDMLVIVYNILAAMMYITAMVIWPLYGLSKPIVSKDKRLVVTVITIFNTIVYTTDTIYSIYFVLCVRSQ